MHSDWAWGSHAQRWLPRRGIRLKTKTGLSKSSLCEQPSIIAFNSASPRPHFPRRKPRLGKSYSSSAVRRVSCSLLPTGITSSLLVHLWPSRPAPMGGHQAVNGWRGTSGLEGQTRSPAARLPLAPGRLRLGGLWQERWAQSSRI